MTPRAVALIILVLSGGTLQAMDITKLPPMDNYGWPEVAKISGRYVEVLETALRQFREDHFSTSGDLRHFTVSMQRRGDRVAIAFAPDYHEASSRGLPGRNKYGTYITYFVSLRTLKLMGFHFERD